MRKKVILKAMMMMAEGTAKATEFKLPEHTANGGMPTNQTFFRIGMVISFALFSMRLCNFFLRNE